MNFIVLMALMLIVSLLSVGVGIFKYGDTHTIALIGGVIATFGIYISIVYAWASRK